MFIPSLYYIQHKAQAPTCNFVIYNVSLLSQESFLPVQERVEIDILTKCFLYFDRSPVAHEVSKRAGISLRFVKTNVLRRKKTGTEYGRIGPVLVFQLKQENKRKDFYSAKENSNAKFL